MFPIDWRPPVLETARLRLRPFDETDAGPLFAHASNPNVTRYTLWEHHATVADTLIFVRDYARCRYLEGVPEPYAICWKDDPDRPVGAVGCFWASQPNRTMELGYWLAEPVWGRGVATETCRVLVEYVFGAYDVQRVQARVIAGNGASARVLEKLGFAHEGTLRAGLLRRGRVEDVMLYGLVPPPSDQVSGPAGGNPPGLRDFTTNRPAG